MCVTRGQGRGGWAMPSGAPQVSVSSSGYFRVPPGIKNLPLLHFLCVLEALGSESVNQAVTVRGGGLLSGCFCVSPSACSCAPTTPAFPPRCRFKGQKEGSTFTSQTSCRGKPIQLCWREAPSSRSRRRVRPPSTTRPRRRHAWIRFHSLSLVF